MISAANRRARTLAPVIVLIGAMAGVTHRLRFSNAVYVAPARPLGPAGPVALKSKTTVSMFLRPRRPKA